MHGADSKIEKGEKQDTAFSLEDLRIREPDLRSGTQTRTDSGGRRDGKKRKRRLIISVAALIGALLLIQGVRQWTGAPRVSVAPAMIEGAGPPIVLTAGGHIRSEKSVVLGSKITGHVTALLCDEGDRVRKGEVLARIDSRELEAQRTQDEATYADAKNHLDRIRNLFDRGVVAKPEFDAAEARFKVAEGRLEATRTLLSQTIIRSPLSGIVLRKHVEKGEIVFPGMKADAPSASAIVTVGDNKHMEVEADINETDIHLVKNKQPVDVFLDAFPQQGYQGKVKEISPTADRNKNTIQVVVAIHKSDEKVRPEMSAKVNFLAFPSRKTERRVLVPAAALNESEDGFSVFIIQDERAQLRFVKPGQTVGTQREILEGLAGGEMVVIGTDGKLRSGEKVVVGQSEQGGE